MFHRLLELILKLSFLSGSTPYWVLDTDYDSYALVYSCVEIDEEYKNGMFH